MALTLFGESVSGQQLLLLAVVVLVAGAFWLARGARRGLDGSPRPYRRAIDSAAARSEKVKGDMEQLLVELDELSKKIGAQIDGASDRLQQIIADADQRISAMRILIAECKRLGDDAGPDGPRQRDRPPVSSPVGPDSPEAPVDVGSSAEPDRRHQRVLELADKGLSALQIAQELHQQPGEVELILNLRRTSP
jgi:hypothetical protein